MIRKSPDAVTVNAMSPVVGRIHKDFHLNLCAFFCRPNAQIYLDGYDTRPLATVHDPCACCVVNQRIKE